MRLARRASYKMLSAATFLFTYGFGGCLRSVCIFCCCCCYGVGCSGIVFFPAVSLPIPFHSYSEQFARCAFYSPIELNITHGIVVTMDSNFPLSVWTFYCYVIPTRPALVLHDPPYILHTNLIFVILSCTYYYTTDWTVQTAKTFSFHSPYLVDSICVNFHIFVTFFFFCSMLF